jgi:glycosyltransferase involved in cell wall biosynthesis
MTYGAGGWRVTVLICALNEAKNLPHVLPFIPDFVDEVLMIDGHSTDETVMVARRLRPAIRILQQPGTGKGPALRYGVEQARGDIIVTLDADGETNPLELPHFLDALLAGADWIKGSRFQNGYDGKPLKRIFGNWVIAKTCNLLYGTRFTDVCCGYNAFWRRVPGEVNLWAADGWNYEPLLVARLLRARRDVRELSYQYRGRLSGDSKLPDLRQGLRAVWVLVRERFRRHAV